MTDSSAPSSPASRKKPNANLARGIEELDAMASLAIPKRASWTPPVEAPRTTSPNTPTMAGVSGVGTSSVSEVSGRPTMSSPRVTRPPKQSTQRSPSEPAIWPQWAFAAAVLGAALWYLFSTEPHRKSNHPVQVEKRALQPVK